METFTVRDEAGSKVDFCFSLVKGDGTWLLILSDRKGNSAIPDYRRYSGAVRAALRDFVATLKTEENRISWGSSDPDDPDSSIRSPDPLLLDSVAASGLLRDGQGKSLVPSAEAIRLVLSIRDIGGGGVSVEPDLVPEGDSRLLGVVGSEEGPAENAPDLSFVSSGHVLRGSKLYRMTDLGSLWMEAPFLASRIQRPDLPAFLALALSRFPSLGVIYGQYAVNLIRSRIALPALLFKEVDAYGYLHVRPVASLPGYSPGFFEDHEIVKVVEIDDDEKTLGIAEVIFPLIAEDEFRSLLSRSGTRAKTSVYEEGGRFILAPDFAEQFLSENMAEIMTRFALFECQALAHYKLRVVKPKLRMSLVSGIDFMEGKAQIQLGDQYFSYGRFMADIRKEGFLTLNDGSRAYPDQKEIARFERLITKAKGEDDEVRVSFFDLPALSRDEDLQADGDAWKKAEHFYRDFNRISEKGGDFSLSGGELRPYQLYGVKWLEHIRDNDLGGCLADEMGLGKTIQVISLLKRCYASGMQEPSLVIMPRTLIFNWKAELERFAPDLPCIIHYGTRRDTAAIQDGAARIVLSTYATLRNDSEVLASVRFGYLVLDESQNIKNAETKTSAAVLGIKARYRLALSGTPVENNLGDLYSLFRFLNPSFFGGRTEFMKKYMRPIQEKKDDEVLRDLKSRIYPFMLRRLKRDVLSDLPPKTEQTALIELDPHHLAVYERRRMELKVRIDQAIAQDGFLKNQFMILQALGELRRLAGVPEADGEYGGISAKREYLKEMIGEIAAEGHKCLIFTNYLATVELVSEDLGNLGMANLVMTGSTVDRQSLVRRFQADPEIRAFIMTLKTGGVGLNLTAADYVFIVDPWWNRSAESQAIDRTHRIGQVNPVFCYRMIAKDTIEEKILELQERKATLVSSILSSDTEVGKALDEDDIRYLLG